MLPERSRWKLGGRGLTILGGAAVAVAALALPSTAATRPHDVLCPSATSTTDGFVACQVRLLDTRTSPQPGPITGFAEVQVGDNAPAGGTVELTITATNAAGGGYVTAYPEGTAAPDTSNLNFEPGKNYASTVIVEVPASGKIELKLVGAATNLVVDEQGFFQPSVLTGMAPVRLADSRRADGGFAKTGTQSGTASITLPADATYSGDLLALNVTSVTPAPPRGQRATGGYVETYGATGAPNPATSSLNQLQGAIVSNVVFVRPDAKGKITFDVEGAPTNLVVDLDGYAPTGSTFVGAKAQRVADSRTGAERGSFMGARTLILPAGLLPAGTTAVALNITATDTTGVGYEVAYLAGATRPATSELQFVKGSLIAQSIVVPVRINPSTGNGTVTLDVQSAKANLVVDFQGSIGSASTSANSAN